ncbi:MAG: hypothetical protein V4486_01410 [Patescibacteria group bacterium]
MKKIVFKFIAPVVMFAIIVTTMALVAQAENDSNNKISICHKTGPSWQYMDTPAGPSLDAHLGHGDFLYTGGEIEDKDGWCVDNAPITQVVDACPNEDTDPGVQPSGPCNSDDVCPDIAGIQTNLNQCTPPGPLGCDISGTGGSVTDNGTGGDGTANAEFHNGGDAAITVTFGSYQTYSPYTPNDPNFDPHGTWLTTQTLFDHQTLTIPPCSSLTFQINVPNCSYQIDLYKDGVLNWNVPFPEGFTLYYGDVFNQGNMCTPPPTQCPAGTHLVGEECIPDEGGGCNINASSTIMSDASTQVDSHNAALLSFIHPAWTASIPSALWIWATNPVQFPDGNDLTKVFTKTFNIVGTPTSGSLEIAADNTYVAKVNGITVGSETVNGNTFAAQQTYNVLPQLHTGSNTIEITATNWVHGAGHADFPQDASSNPAGLLYKLSINNNECVTPPPADVTVTIEKFIDANGLSHASTVNTTNATFSMHAVYPGGEGDFNLGSTGFNNPDAYEATTALMPSGSNYSTSENNVATSCTANNQGQYMVEGYKIGDTEALALASATVSTASLTNITSNKFIIVVNKLCGQVLGDETVKIHVLKYLDGSLATDTSASGYDFPMTATWTASNIGGGVQGTGTYTLGENFGGAADLYGADTAAMATGSAYTTSEITDNTSNVLPIGGTCVEGKFRLVGYSTGATQAFAEAASQTNTAPALTNITSDQYIIVWNEKCVISNILTEDTTDNGNGGGGGGGGHHGGSSNNNNGDVLGDSDVQGVGGGQLAAAPAGEVLGAEVGLPRTGSGDVAMNILVLALSGLITLLGSTYLLRKKNS